MKGGDKTILLVDDEPSVLRLLQEGLPDHLPGFAVATARNGAEAVEYLSSHPVDVLVTDVNMPIMDGFELLAHASRHLPDLPVVVLSVMAPDAVHRGVPALGSIQVLRKPASPALVAQTVSEGGTQSPHGRLPHVPLATLLQLMQLERKTCSLLVRSGHRKGRLHFLSGELVNAYTFELDVDGEEAARNVLAWDTVDVEFERSLHNHDRRIHTPLEQLLLEVAMAHDERVNDIQDIHEDIIDDILDDSLDDSPAAVGEHDEVAARPQLEPADPAPATPQALDEAAEHLDRAVQALRTRATDIWRLLDDLPPRLASAAAAITASAEAVPPTGPSAAEWRQVGELASQLARTADRLADPGATQPSSGSG